MDTIEAIHGRRSIRSYEDRDVERAVIEAVIDDAAQAPPPFSGLVPWTFNIIEGRERIAAYGARAMQYAKDNRTGDPIWNWVDMPGFKVFWDAPVVIIISGPSADCVRAGQTLMLSAHARGLGTCWVGAPLPWLIQPAIRTELQIPNGLEPVAVLCLGYPAEKPLARKREKPCIIWNAPEK
jgi:nitroreductase